MPEMTAEEAYAAFLHEAIMEDGMVIREEQDALLEHLDAQSHIQTPADLLLKQVQAHASQLGGELLNVAGQCIPADMKKTTLRAIATMIGSDDDQADDEMMFLHRACGCLGLDEAEAQALHLDP